MNNKIESYALKYEKRREHFKNVARTNFLGFHSFSNQLVASMNELVARHLLYAEGKKFEYSEQDEYIIKLIVSFSKTHFILSDLIICSELIDASVLLRKQFELMSRLVEIDKAIDVSKLIHRTPNVRHLENDLNRLYSVYSQLSHSSDIEKLNLTGSIKTDDGHFTAVYPVFSENSYVSMLHLYLLITQYHFWAVEKYESWFPEYKRKNDCALFVKCHEAYSEIYYKSPCFKDIGRSVAKKS